MGNQTSLQAQQRVSDLISSLSLSEEGYRTRLVHQLYSFRQQKSTIEHPTHAVAELLIRDLLDPKKFGKQFTPALNKIIELYQADSSIVNHCLGQSALQFVEELEAEVQLQSKWMAAARAADVKQLQRLIDWIDVNAQDDRGCTVLHILAHQPMTLASWSCMQLLLLHSLQKLYPELAPIDAVAHHPAPAPSSLNLNSTIPAQQRSQSSPTVKPSTTSTIINNSKYLFQQRYRPRRTLSQSVIDLNARDRLGWTPLHHCLSSRAVQIASTTAPTSNSFRLSPMSSSTTPSNSVPSKSSCIRYTNTTMAWILLSLAPFHCHVRTCSMNSLPLLDSCEPDPLHLCPLHHTIGSNFDIRLPQHIFQSLSTKLQHALRHHWSFMAQRVQQQQPLTPQPDWTLMHERLVIHTDCLTDLHLSPLSMACASFPWLGHRHLETNSSSSIAIGGHSNLIGRLLCHHHHIYAMVWWDSLFWRMRFCSHKLFRQFSVTSGRTALIALRLTTLLTR